MLYGTLWFIVKQKKYYSQGRAILKVIIAFFESHLEKGFKYVPTILEPLMEIFAAEHSHPFSILAIQAIFVIMARYPNATFAYMTSYQP
jgi:hypothetical protein